jgi:hypothetical protein
VKALGRLDIGSHERLVRAREMFGSQTVTEHKKRGSKEREHEDHCTVDEQPTDLRLGSRSVEQQVEQCAEKQNAYKV